MGLLREARNRARQAVAPVLGAAVVGYFVYHTIQGERGLSAYIALTQETERARAVLAQARARREALERRVRLLRPDSLDLDMLDERVRAVLDLVDEDEIVIFDSSS